MKIDVELEFRATCTLEQFHEACKLRDGPAPDTKDGLYFTNWWYVEPGMADDEYGPDEDDRTAIIRWPQDGLALDAFLEIAALFVKCGGALSFYGGGDHTMHGYYQLADGRDMPATSAYLQVRDEKIAEVLTARIDAAVRVLRGRDDDAG